MNPIDSTPHPALLSEMPHGGTPLAWPTLYARVGAEVAGPLTTALDRIEQLAQTGQITRPALKSLQHEVSQARRAAMVSQQLARYAGARLRQSHERVDLAALINDRVAQRARAAVPHGIVPVTQSLKPAAVILDPTLLHTMLDALLDWSIEHAQAQVQLTVDHKAWPPNARLTCSFLHQRPEMLLDPNASHEVDALDTLCWQLVLHAAYALGLPLHRRDTASRCTVSIEFPRTVHEEISGVSTLELDHDPVSAMNSKPLAGSHVLVVAARRELRTQVRDAIRHMGLLVDYVNSIDEARDFCAGGLPHAIVYDAAMGEQPFEALRRELLDQTRDIVFVQIADDGELYEVSGFNGSATARVGRAAMATGLPAALLFELSKNL